MTLYDMHWACSVCFGVSVLRRGLTLKLTAPVGVPAPVGSVTVPVTVSAAPAATVEGLAAPLMTAGVAPGCRTHQKPLILGIFFVMSCRYMP